MNEDRKLVNEIETLAQTMYGWSDGNRPRLVVTSATGAGGKLLYRATVRVDPFLPPLARSGATAEAATHALLSSLRCLTGEGNVRRAV